MKPSPEVSRRRGGRGGVRVAPLAARIRRRRMSCLPSLALSLLLGWTPAAGADAPGATSRGEPRYIEAWDNLDAVPGAFTQVRGLFIGIDRYANHPGLGNAENDARALAKVMQERLGCVPTVLLGEQARMANLDRVLGELGEQSDPGGLFIFHFSGHGLGIAFQQGMYADQTGLLILQDAPPDLTSPQAGNHVLDMTLLQRKLDQAGIQAKHQLFVLDCCYSGIAAHEGFKSFRSLAQRRSDEFHLDHQARLILTAGGPTQPVLDGGPSGHGLLTGALIRLLNDKEMLEQRARLAYDQEFVRMQDLFSDLSDIVQESAEEMIRGFYPGATAKRGIVVRHPEGVRHFLRGDERLDETAPSSELREWLGRRIPYPQQNPTQQIAQLMIPVAPLRARSTSTSSDTVGKEKRDGEGLKSVETLEEWSRGIAENYNDPEYGAALRSLFNLIETGASPSVSGGHDVVVEAEVFVRPDVTPSMAGLDRLPDSPAGRLELERARSSRPEWAWRRVQPAGECVLDGEWLRLRIANKGASPFFYYLLVIDEAGIAQWLAPENPSPGSDFASYTFGRAPLPPGSELLIPGFVELESPEGEKVRLPDSWPVEGALDLNVVLVVSSSRWEELERALGLVSTKGFALLRKGEATRAVAKLALPAVPFRALGRRQSSVESAPPPEGPKAETAPAIVSRTQRGLLVHTWRLDVLASLPRDGPEGGAPSAALE